MCYSVACHSEECYSKDYHYNDSHSAVYYSKECHSTDRNFAECHLISVTMLNVILIRFMYKVSLGLMPFFRVSLLLNVSLLNAALKGQSAEWHSVKVSIF
jgi:hypothetical protein